MSKHYSKLAFREAQSVEELIALFRLRYQGYLESVKCATLVNENPIGLELDVHDWQSSHIGLFQEGSYGAKPIAYARLVQESIHWQSAMVDELVGHFEPQISIPDGAGSILPLPVVNSCGSSQHIHQLLAPYRAHHKSIIEASRFVFSSEIRAGGFARTFVDACMGLTLCRDKTDLIVLACHPRHVAFYLRYGFELRLDGKSNDYKGLEASIVTCEKDNVKPNRWEIISNMGQSLNTRGHVLFPTGDFRRVRA